MSSPIQPFPIASPLPFQAQQMQQCIQSTGQIIPQYQQPQSYSPPFSQSKLPIISATEQVSGFVQAHPSPFLQSQGQPIRVPAPGIQLQQQQYPVQQQLPPINSLPQPINIPRSPSQIPPMQVSNQQLLKQPNFQGQIHQEQLYNLPPPPHPRSSSPPPSQFQQVIRKPLDYQSSPRQYPQQQTYPTQPTSGQFISVNPQSTYGPSDEFRDRFQDNLMQLPQNVERVNQHFQGQNNLGNPRVVQQGFAQQTDQPQQYPQNLSIPNLQSLPNPMITYQQQLAIHQQQQEKLNQIQSKNQQISTHPQSYYQPQAQLDSQQQYNQPQHPVYPQKPRRLNSPQNHSQQFEYPIYNAGKDCEEKLFQLIEENQALIAENEYYKKHLTSLPQETQDSIILGQQIHSLRQQVSSLQQQLEVQTDDAIMWANREKNLAERCKSLYEQLQIAQKQLTEFVDKNQNISSNITQQQSPQQGTQQQQYQQQLPSQKESSPRDQFERIPKTSNQQEIEKDLPNKNQQSLPSQKSRQELVQSIIKQYKLGGELPSESYTKTVNRSQSNCRDNDKMNQRNEDIIQIHEENQFDWKTKYQSLTKKLNGLNELSNNQRQRDNVDNSNSDKKYKEQQFKDNVQQQ